MTLKGERSMQRKGITSDAGSREACETGCDWVGLWLGTDTEEPNRLYTGTENQEECGFVRGKVLERYVA